VNTAITLISQISDESKLHLKCTCKVYVKVHSRSGHDPEWEKDNSTLSLTSALVGCGYTTPRPCRFTPWNRDRSLGGPKQSVWTGADNLVPTGIRSPDLPLRSEWQYRLSYPDPLVCSMYCYFYLDFLLLYSVARIHKI
jgi:hypothetical protein